ncbi:MAG: DUF1259 domain-containing protein [Bacteroidota bacterium]
MKVVMGLAVLAIVLAPEARSQEKNESVLENIFGRKGTVQGSVTKFTFPRTDLNVKVGSVVVDPGLALTSWIAFGTMGDHSMVMGDLVLLDREVAPVESGLIEEGIEVTAIHNHILNESPAIKYLHFEGMGDAVKIAGAMKRVLERTGTPLTIQQAVRSSSQTDWSAVESVLGRKGTHRGTLLLLGIPRTEKIMENGMEIPGFMGMATGMNLQMVGASVATTGDFVLLPDEVNPVAKALTEHGIAVTAIHSHMLFESPRLFFLHFWGMGTPKEIAQGLRAALDKTNSMKP